MKREFDQMIWDIHSHVAAYEITQLQAMFQTQPLKALKAADEILRNITKTGGMINNEHIRTQRSCA